MRGADPTALEEKVKKWYGEGEEEGDTDVGVKGHVGVTTESTVNVFTTLVFIAGNVSAVLYFSCVKKELF